MVLTRKNRKITGFIGATSFGLTSPLAAFQNSHFVNTPDTFYLGGLRVPAQPHTYDGCCSVPHVGVRGQQTLAALLSTRARRFCPAAPSLEARISCWLRYMELADSFRIYEMSPTVGDAMLPAAALPTDAEWEYIFDFSNRVQLPPEDLLAVAATAQQRFIEFISGKRWTLRFEVFTPQRAGLPEDWDIDIQDASTELIAIFPVLVACYIVPEGATLVLEQPDIGLNPKQQALVAELLVIIATERRVNIVFHSHSEALLTRLQWAVAEKHIATEDVQLYSVVQEEYKLNAIALKMDTYGNIHNFPPRLFHSEMEDLLRITRAHMRADKETPCASNR